MILDIRWEGTAPPIQIQGVRLASVYPNQDGVSEPQLVIHFANFKPQQNIPLQDVRCITISND